MRLKNKVAIITGGGGDIGRAIALRFSEEGAQVLVADISKEAGQETVEMINNRGGKAVFHRTDMTKQDEVKALIEKALDTFQRIDIVCNNAGVNSEEKKIPDVSLEEWQKVIAINLTGVFLGMKYAIPSLEPGSSIVNIASIAGIKGQKLVSPYSASKSSVMTLTKTAATEFGRKNIRVNAVAPGVIDTKMVDDWRKTDKWPILSTANALRRIGKAEEVANAVLFLASDEASFITGETLIVDGGTLNL
ncbi:SDR family NAD(P)-dependent oxidoreductase [Aliibacillus thermotolerans]|uniref:SDR family NAD(P)-dependent oxidoreductase n=1 Tax=Aliibacillus thermotolerans TaxID=1834418 RepID=A0ABW0U7P4_9BACI|nr:glucose 1-dehydrogenase [Aliibacillus thermotolerans]MDA3129941.1 glucose 1-dehydrogenase [Aliibacillus thermotolerans]